MTLARRPLAAGLAFGIVLIAVYVVLVGVPGWRSLDLLLGAEPGNFTEARFVFATLPRLTIALVIGAALGLAGSLLQQLTQNVLVSPMTLGVSSGAWLALVLTAIIWPGFASTDWVAFAGAMVAAGLLLAVTGSRGLAGLQAPLAGMAISLLFGSVAATAMLLSSPYTEHLFLWGAGDLTQTGWDRFKWLAPRVLPGAVLAVLLVRPLTLLRLAALGAGGRGLSLWPVALATACAALHLAAVSVAAAGVIGFVGLVAPNLARLAGARRPGAELAASAALGSLCLVAADGLAIGLSRVAGALIPTGAATALVGAPALIWLLRSRLKAEDHDPFALAEGRARVGRARTVWIAFALAGLTAVALVIGRDNAGWTVALLDPALWTLRWPRILGAAAAGAGMALSGMVLQRLIRNPLASPDLLGMSSGAVAALIGVALVSGASTHVARLPVALAGSGTALVLLLLFSRRRFHAPGVMALTGIALGAALDALVKVSMAAGTPGAFEIFGWMSGSTYRLNAVQAATLAALVVAGCCTALLMTRALTLVSAGDALAMSRGLAIRTVRPLFMILAAAVAAFVTAFVGPIAFVGLVAPHIAVLLGARRVVTQVVAAPAIGAGLMILSDWLGRTVLFPVQLPAGSIAAVIGGTYFLLLLKRSSRRR